MPAVDYASVADSSDVCASETFDVPFFARLLSGCALR